METNKKFCDCEKPLIGFRPKVGLRCRLCNKLIDPTVYKTYPVTIEQCIYDLIVTQNPCPFSQIKQAVMARQTQYDWSNTPDFLINTDILIGINNLIVRQLIKINICGTEIVFDLYGN